MMDRCKRNPKDSFIHSGRQNDRVFISYRLRTKERKFCRVLPPLRWFSWGGGGLPVGRKILGKAGFPFSRQIFFLSVVLRRAECQLY